MPHTPHPHDATGHPLHASHAHPHSPGSREHAGEHRGEHRDKHAGEHGEKHRDKHGGEHGAGAHDHNMSEMLDLDAEVAATQFADLTTRIADLAGGHPVRDVLDLGSGTGTGTLALLRRFPGATVTAVDTSEGMLRHLSASAGRHGFTDRVRPVRADLDAGWPDLGRADLVWASSSMHHMTDPDRVLRDIHAALRPGGLFAMIEMESLPRFLPDDIGIGRTGLEARCHAEANRARDEHLPHIGSDWPARLGAAGFTVREARTLTVDLSPPLVAEAVRYARATLRRLRAGVAERLSPDDRSTLDLLLADDGPHALENRGDLIVRSTRAVWLTTPA